MSIRTQLTILINFFKAPPCHHPHIGQRSHSVPFDASLSVMSLTHEHDDGVGGGVRD